MQLYFEPPAQSLIATQLFDNLLRKTDAFVVRIQNASFKQFRFLWYKVTYVVINKTNFFALESSSRFITSTEILSSLKYSSHNQTLQTNSYKIKHLYNHITALRSESTFRRCSKNSPIPPNDSFRTSSIQKMFGPQH